MRVVTPKPTHWQDALQVAPQAQLESNGRKRKPSTKQRQIEQERTEAVEKRAAATAAASARAANGGKRVKRVHVDPLAISPPAPTLPSGGLEKRNKRVPMAAPLPAQVYPAQALYEPQSTWNDEVIDPQLRPQNTTHAGPAASDDEDDEDVPADSSEGDASDSEQEHGKAWGDPDDGSDGDEEEEEPQAAPVHAPIQYQLLPPPQQLQVVEVMSQAPAVPAGVTAPLLVLRPKRRHRSAGEQFAHIPRKGARNERSTRPRQGDYDDTTRELLGTAISLFRCKVSTRHAFPDHGTESQWAAEAWSEACQEMSVAVVAPTVDIIRVICSRSSQLRRELKTKVVSIVEGAYGFDTAKDKKTQAANRAKVEELMEERAFLYKVRQPTLQGLYYHPALQRAINVMWFANKHDEGVEFPKYFNPIPLPTIALAITAIECCIDEWSSGSKNATHFTGAAYKDLYEDHLQSLIDFDEHTQVKNLGLKLRRTLHDTGRHHAGVGPIASQSRQRRVVSTAAFQAALAEDSDVGSDEDA
ncbi:hypothetical protein BC834DRAFT_843806 [Gloeopeniophorella convolvens]|nr:hypothetical protein BC834DRAFT_843806 [Gloeopeniophorella convolvens]